MAQLAKAWTCIIALAVTPSGCESDPDSCDDTVITPAGPSAKQCVHQVPNGATVVEDDAGTASVIVNGNVVETYPPCPCGAHGPIGPPFVADVEAGTPDEGAAEDVAGDRPEGE
jgi:hypothetical protein